MFIGDPCITVFLNVLLILTASWVSTSLEVTKGVFEMNLHLDTAFILMGLSDCEHLLIWFLFYLINLVMQLTI